MVKSGSVATLCLNALLLVLPSAASSVENVVSHKQSEAAVAALNAAGGPATDHQPQRYYNYPHRTPKVPAPEGCTSMVVHPEASVDGGMTTHTNDCKKCDFRLSKVPARDWPENSNRPVFRVRLEYPKYIGDLRGESYKLENTDTTPFPWKPSEPVGYIPQVPHTFSYIDGLYGVLNEHQVGMGESTCAARLVALPVFDGGKALFDISDLTRAAMERARTARQAIQIMGDLAERYGFYGAEWRGPLAEGEAGEALTITDPHESYVFHILPDDSGTSAVWVAQRLPPGHMSVVSNSFMIGEIDFNDHDNFLYSSNIKDVAIRSNFWRPEFGPFHFSRVFGEQVFYEIYCSRRTWRLYNLVAPSLNIPANLTAIEMPFSVPVERKLSKFDLFKFQRDHFEGTEFDLTKGLQAGPFGNPNRYDRGEGGGLSFGLLMQGYFERSISLYRTVMSSVTLSRSWVPHTLAQMWWGPAAPHATFYSPLYVNSHVLPAPFTHGSLYRFDRTTAWWASTTIGGWMEKMFSHISVDVYSEQAKMEGDTNQAVIELEQHVTNLLETGQKTLVIPLLTTFQNQRAQESTDHWWWFFERLVEKFHDGYRVDDFHAEAINPTSVFYPVEWLEAVGFFHGVTPNFTKLEWQYVRPSPTLSPLLNAAVPAALSRSSSSSSNSLPAPDLSSSSSSKASFVLGKDALVSMAAADRSAMADADAAGVTVSTVFAIVIAVFVMGLVLGVLVGQRLAVKRFAYLPIANSD